MKLYTYKFVDGTTSTVMVEDDLYDLLVEMDRQEKYGNRRETRRHVSLEKLVEQNVEPTVNDKYFVDEILGDVQDERLQSALKMLTENQRNVFMRIAIDGLSFRKLAREQGLNKDTIRGQFIAAKEKIKKFL